MLRRAGAALLGIARGEEARDDILFRCLLAGQLADDPAARKHQHPVANAGQLLGVRGIDDAAAVLADIFADRHVNVVPRAGIDALGRLVDQQHLGVGAEAAGEHGFLLIAAGEAEDGLLLGRGDDAEILDHAACRLALGAPRHQAEFEEFFELRQHHIFTQTELGENRFAGTVGAQIEKTVGERFARRGGAHPFAGATHDPARLFEPDQGTHRLALTIAVGAGEAEDLAALNVETDIVKIAAGEIARAEDRRAAGEAHLLRIFALNVASDHERDEVLLGQILGHREGTAMDAVAQDRDPVGELENFRQAVADIDHPGAHGGELADDLGELAHTFDIQRRGRLVQEQHLGVGHQRLDDLDELAVRRGEVADQRGDGNAETHAADLRFGPGHDVLEFDRAARRAEIEVLRDGQLAHQGIVLIDGRQAEARSEARVGGGEILAIDFDRAGILFQGAGGDFQEGAFAGAVLAEDRVHLAGLAVDADIV